MSLNDQLKNIHKSFQSFKGGNVKPVSSPSVLSEAIQSVTESAQESIPEASAPVSTPVVEAPKTKSSTIIWIVVIALVVLVIFGIILYVQYKNKKKNELARPGPGSNRQAAFQPNTGNPRPTSTQQEDTSDLVPI